jgi:plasmid stability protein
MLAHALCRRYAESEMDGRGRMNMPSLQIRDLPEDVYEALSLRAQSENRSLAQQAIVELRRIPELQAGERRKKLLAQIRNRLSAGETRRVSVSPEDLVREDRDR